MEGYLMKLFKYSILLLILSFTPIMHIYSMEPSTEDRLSALEDSLKDLKARVEALEEGKAKPEEEEKEAEEKYMKCTKERCERISRDEFRNLRERGIIPGYYLVKCRRGACKRKGPRKFPGRPYRYHGRRR
jgi:hypothetical protein